MNGVIKKSLLMTLLLAGSCVVMALEETFEANMSMLEGELGDMDGLLTDFALKWTNMNSAASLAKNSLERHLGRYDRIYSCFLTHFNSLKDDKETCEGNIASLLVLIDQERSGAAGQINGLKDAIQVANTERNDLATHINTTFGESKALATEVFELMESVARAYDAAVNERNNFIAELNDLEAKVGIFNLSSDNRNNAQAICNYTASDSCSYSTDTSEAAADVAAHDTFVVNTNAGLDALQVVTLDQ